LIDIDLWYSDVKNEVDKLICFIRIGSLALYFFRVTLVNQCLKPLIESLGVVNFIDPKLDEVQIVEVEY
jgi:hypothetical protein